MRHRVGESGALGDHNPAVLIQIQGYGILCCHSRNGHIVVQGGVGGLKLRDFEGLEIPEPEVQHGLGVRVMGQVAVQHNGDQRHISAFGAGDQGVARQGRISCFSAERSVIVGGIVAVPHFVMVGDGIAVGKFLCRSAFHIGEAVSAGTADFYKGWILDGRLGDLCHVVGGGVVVFVVESAGIGEMASGAAQAGGPLVHQVRKGLSGAADVLRKGVGALVGRGQ